MAEALLFSVAPAPWTCKCTAYVLIFFVTSSQGLPQDIAYDPVEGSVESFTAADQAGSFRGGTGMIQIVRYTETPAGPTMRLSLSQENLTRLGEKSGA